MDPQQKAKRIARDIIVATQEATHRGLSLKLVYETAELAIAQAIASPVPPPSADARAKLEQAIAFVEGIAEKYPPEVFPVDGASVDCHSARVMRHASRWIADELRQIAALPPHEGETPQDERFTDPSMDAEAWRYEGEQLERELDRRGSPRNDGGIVLSLYGRVTRLLSEGETPQPAAEPSGWRDIASAPKDKMHVDLWVYWPHGGPKRVTDCWQGRDGVWMEWAYAKDGRYPWPVGGQALYWMPLPLPPVAQTPQERD